MKRLHDAIAAGEDIDIELLNYRNDGTTFWNALYLSPVRAKGGEIQFFFASQLDVTERVERQARIAEQKAEVEKQVEERTADRKAALGAQTLLLHEVDHRVKNNLTMIGSLLRLQARTIGDPAISSRLEAMLERVDALATVHRRLYQSKDVKHFDIGAFTKNLVADVVGASGRSEITVEPHVECIEVPSAHASSLGLVLNEVLTNAIKHGFPDGRAGTLEVSAKSDGQTALIVIRDDGPGLGGGSPGTSGLGAKLIRRLSKQVGATVHWANASPGTRVTISFPVEEYAAPHAPAARSHRGGRGAARYGHGGEGRGFGPFGAGGSGLAAGSRGLGRRDLFRPCLCRHPVGPRHQCLTSAR